jgi:AraC-like DNA-binding protein/quercetin dioxygenase-like cupin family protein
MQNPQANALIDQFHDQSLLFNVIQMKKGFHDGLHQHAWHQIIYPLKGLVKTQAQGCQYFIPHHRAVFIPANTLHESWIVNDTNFIGIYLNPDNHRETPRNCRVIQVSNFLRELILTLKANQPKQPKQPKITPANERLIQVLYDQIWLDQAPAFELPLPTDRRLMPIVNALLAQPELDLTLDDWSAKVGASKRTLSRLFNKQVNLSYLQWRQKIRLTMSLSLLAQNTAVQDVAHQVGYQSVSSFIAAFKQSFKLTPQQYKHNEHEFDLMH